MLVLKFSRVFKESFHLVSVEGHHVRLRLEAVTGHRVDGGHVVGHQSRGPENAILGRRRHLPLQHKLVRALSIFVLALVLALIALALVFAFPLALLALLLPGALLVAVADVRAMSVGLLLLLATVVAIVAHLLNTVVAGGDGGGDDDD